MIAAVSDGQGWRFADVCAARKAAALLCVLAFVLSPVLKSLSVAASLHPPASAQFFSAARGGNTAQAMKGPNVCRAASCMAILTQQQLGFPVGKTDLVPPEQTLLLAALPAMPPPSGPPRSDG